MPTAQRVLEILPTATVWLIITAPIWAAILAPAALGFGLILFSIYWLWKSFSFASGVLIGFWRLQHAQQRDWIADSRHLAGYDQLQHLVIVPTCGESEEIVAGVKKNGVPVEYITYPNEGHGFQKKENQIATSRATLIFLNKYLKGS